MVVPLVVPRLSFLLRCPREVRGGVSESFGDVTLMVGTRFDRAKENAHGLGYCRS